MGIVTNDADPALAQDLEAFNHDHVVNHDRVDPSLGIDVILAVVHQDHVTRSNRRLHAVAFDLNERHLIGRPFLINPRLSESHPDMNLIFRRETGSSADLSGHLRNVKKFFLWNGFGGGNWITLDDAPLLFPFGLPVP